ncbi:hypothetical protein ABK040_004842 [Willaertia magna]
MSDSEHEEDINEMGNEEEMIETEQQHQEEDVIIEDDKEGDVKMKESEHNEPNTDDNNKEKKKKKKKDKNKQQPNANHANITAQVEIQPGPDTSVSTFIFHKESHTMGNALRYMLMKNKKVSFCGYTVPHPLEAKMNLRLQTVDERYSAQETLEEALTTLQSITEHVLETFNSAVEKY